MTDASSEYVFVNPRPSKEHVFTMFPQVMNPSVYDVQDWTYNDVMFVLKSVQ